MGISRYIWSRNERYYLYDTYTSYEKAISMAKYLKKKHKKDRKNKRKVKWIIRTDEKAGILGFEKRYALYMAGVIGARSLLPF